MKLKGKILSNGVVILLIAIFLSIAININLDKTVELKYSVQTDQIQLMIISIFYYVFLKQVIVIKDKRAQILSGILAVIFSAIQIIGYSIDTYYSLEAIIGSKELFIKNIFKFIAYLITFYGIILYIIKNWFSKIVENKEQVVKKYFTNNKRSFFICVAILFIAYLPYLLHNFPGLYTTDSMAEMTYGIKNVNHFSNHHPVFHIWIIYGCINIGKLIGSMELGVALYSVLQMIFLACTFSYVINYMARKNIGVIYRICALIFFAIYPIFGIYSVMMWKDVPFAMILVFLVIQLIEAITNKQYFKQKRNIVKFIIIFIFTILLRNNGVYIVLITAVGLVIGLKGNRKRAAIILGSILLFYILWKGPIFKLLNVQDGPVREMMSVPVQQIARVVKYRGKEISEEEMNEIQRFIKMNREEMAEKYNPIIADNIKDNFRNEKFSENKMDFISIWMKLFFRFPKEYVEAFLANSYGYWYPQEINDTVPTWYDYSYSENALQYTRKPVIKIEAIDNLYKNLNEANTPILAMTLSVGLAFWIMLLTITYMIYKKKYTMILAYLPILSLWLTTIASPVWCEYRYIYGIITTLPILTIVAISIANKDEL